MKLDNEAYSRFINYIKLHYAYPLPFDLSGAYFEEIFALSVNGKRGIGKDLFDVTRGTVGWSLKTTQWYPRANKRHFEIVLKRSDILRDDNLRGLYEEARPEELGSLIQKDLQDFLDLSKQKQGVEEARIAFLLRNRTETQFILFQVPYQIPQNLRWERGNQSNRKSLIGFDGNRKVLRWYRSGTQTFGVYNVPDAPSEAHWFEVSASRVMSVEYLMQMIDDEQLVVVKD